MIPRQAFAPDATAPTATAPTPTSQAATSPDTRAAHGQAPQDAQGKGHNGPEARSSGVAGPPGVPVHEALALTGGGALAQISLNDQLYVLRITRAGKLILTK